MRIYVFERKDKGERDSLRKDSEMALDSLLSYLRSFLATPAIAMLLASTAPQSSAQPQQPSEADVFPPDKLAPFDPTPERTTDSSKITAVTGETSAKQSKRILGIFPNYRGVSELLQLPLRKKFWLATQDSSLIRYGWNARRRSAGEELHSGVWTRRRSLRPLLLAML
jgi:hypothetical protein